MGPRRVGGKGAGRLAGTLLVVCAAGLAVSPPVGADSGVAIDVGRIAIGQPLAPGGAYRLPALTVRNPGSERTRYRVTVSPLVSEHRSPGSGWFRFEPVALSLDPGATRVVRVRLVVPTDAIPGDYAALIGPQIESGSEGASVGAAAAARLTFAVEPSSTLAAWWLSLETWLGDHAQWWAAVLSLLLLGAAARAVRRRFAFTVGRRA